LVPPEASAVLFVWRSLSAPIDQDWLSVEALRKF
jgi:hypothetical protein